MTVTVASFRGHFSAFGDAGDYPAPDVDFWILVAAQLVNADRWGGMTDTAIELLVAHHLSLEFMAKREGELGNQPGVPRGMLSNGSVDKASWSYDTSAITEEGGGHYNSTIYGQRFYRLTRLFGAGPVQVDSSLPVGTSIAWPGFNYPPFG
jgi:hypothetical protein